MLKIIILKPTIFLDIGKFREYMTQVSDKVFLGDGTVLIHFDLVDFCINILL